MHQPAKPLNAVSMPLNDWSHLSARPMALRLNDQAIARAASQPQVRLIRLDEINEDGHQAYRQALANVYATLDAAEPVRLLYLLDGGPNGVSLYFGVVADSTDVDLHEAMKNLRSALEGQLPGINFGAEISKRDKDALLQRLASTQRRGVLLGTPTMQQPDRQGGADEQNFQDIDRLVCALQAGSASTDAWQIVVITQPLAGDEIFTQLNAAYALSSELGEHIRTNVQLGDNSSHQEGTSSGTSDSRTSNSSTSHSKGESVSDSRGKSSGGSQSSSSNDSSSSSSKSTNYGTSENKTTGTTTNDRAVSTPKCNTTG